MTITDDLPPPPFAAEDAAEEENVHDEEKLHDKDDSTSTCQSPRPIHHDEEQAIVFESPRQRQQHRRSTMSPREIVHAVVTTGEAARKRGEAAVNTVVSASRATGETALKTGEAVMKTAVTAGMKTGEVAVKTAVSASRKTGEVAVKTRDVAVKTSEVAVRTGVRASRRVFLKYPRFFALLLGVLVPLWALVFTSLFFGFLLSRVEAPGEVKSNDAYLAARERANNFGWLVVNFTERIPQLCFEDYLGYRRNLTKAKVQEEIGENISLAFYNDESLVTREVAEAFFSGELVAINTTELHSFMNYCGNAAAPISRDLFEKARNVSDDVSGGLSFNWIRCYKGASGVTTEGVDFGPQRRVVRRNPEIRYPAQSEFYETRWRASLQQHQQESYETFLDQYNMTPALARTSAFWDAIDKASGGDVCGYNSAASAWFWFTVMTTVGYGNQAPSEPVGRIMIYTLGFISTLLFGLILVRAGRVVSSILDDMLGRMHHAFVTRPWISMIIWGGINYTWMGALAVVVTRWKMERLGEPFTLPQGYWFAYISITTVGLGDIFLEPEVLLISDLLWIPFLFLIGFTFFSAFLNKLADFIVRFNKNEVTLIDDMLNQLPYAKERADVRRSEAQGTERQHPEESSDGFISNGNMRENAA